ncbi:MAG: hypothetical protein ACK50P_08830, partial [Planctomycetaceae bacterium]
MWDEPAFVPGNRRNVGVRPNLKTSVTDQFACSRLPGPRASSGCDRFLEPELLAEELDHIAEEDIA